MKPMSDDSFTRIRLLEQRADRLENEVLERNRVAESLRESESRYRQLFDANPLPMWVYDLGTLRFLAVNDAAIEHYGYTREQFLAMTIADIRPERDVTALRASVETAHAGIEHSGIWRHRKRNGAIILVEITSHVIDFSGHRAKLVLANDITERIEQDQKIARLNRIRAIKSGISSAVVRLRNRNELLQEACRVAATEGVFPIVWIRLVNERQDHSDQVIWHGNEDALDLIQRLAGRETWAKSDRPSHRAARERRPVIINDLFTDPSITPVRNELLQDGYRSCASFPLRVEGSVAAVLTFLAKEQGFFDTEEVALLEALSADLSYALEYIEKSQRLDYLASYDTLTQLPNARLFADRLEQFVHLAREEHSTVCVVVMDLERFTQINDTLGREAGDELLQQVAMRLADTLKEPYTLGRIAADTFAAACPNQSESIARSLPDQLFEALQRPFTVGAREVSLTAQAGIALFPTDGDDGGIVFQNAEAALKLAKSANEPYEYYSTEMNSRIASRRLLEEQLRTAVATQQFVLHYQPRIDLVSGELVGAEALIRWQHPEKGLTLPGYFITAAEETGLIVEMGAWAIDAVCKQQAAWLTAGIKAVPIAVNLSSVQFDTEGLLSVVRTALATHQLDARLLELELTETTVMKDSAAATKTLQALRKMGIGLALDDFGTGYSSLAVLKRFPFQSVKIDKSFVSDITQNAEDAAIATAIIAMAHRLNLTVVAEGVETEGQFNYLRMQNCDEMQGNFFSAAVPKNTFESQLRGDKRIQLPAETGEGRTLLLVDDEPGIRAALTRMLRSDGYRILTASGGAEALELLAVNRVQVIISDQRMPGMSGTEFLNIVKQLYPDTVRIILSGYTDLQVVTESVNQGAVFKFLTKPWDDTLLREQVRDAFRRIGAQAARG
jgi:diguanylate cyclase (GGDEF)-like protein/PAS domain S-box-containing protein